MTEEIVRGTGEMAGVTEEIVRGTEEKAGVTETCGDD
jgi:hypothetical protein